MKNRKYYIYIFKPYSWNYRGGVIVVVAENFKQAASIAATSCVKKSDDDEDIFGGAFVKNENKINRDKDNQWLLINKFELKNVTEARVIADSHNYGTYY